MSEIFCVINLHGKGQRNIIVHENLIIMWNFYKWNAILKQNVSLL